MIIFQGTISPNKQIMSGMTCIEITCFGKIDKVQKKLEVIKASTLQ